MHVLELSTYVRGRRFVAVGSKGGEIQLIDLSSSEVVETIDDGHSASVWALCMHPNGKSLLSAGADKIMKVCVCIYVHRYACMGSVYASQRKELVLSGG